LLKTTSVKEGQPKHKLQPFMIDAIPLASYERTLKKEKVET
jgi:hypothetical protein